MKVTGIVRRIDDLGRVTIPKAVLKALKLKEGDPMEIFLEEDGGMVLRKYNTSADVLDSMKEALALMDVDNPYYDDLSKLIWRMEAGE